MADGARVVGLYQEFCNAMLESGFKTPEQHADLTRGLDTLNTGDVLEVAEVLTARLGVEDNKGITALTKQFVSHVDANGDEASRMLHTATRFTNALERETRAHLLSLEQ